jgi:hypothetical protein
MYSELRKHLQANIVKRANSAYEGYKAKGVYDLPPGQIPNEALLARNEYRLAQQAKNNPNLPATTRANMASGGVNYTGQSWGESFADYGNRYLDGWRRGLGFESHYGDDPYLDAAGWANNVALSTIPVGGAVGAVGRAGLTAARLAGRAAPMLARGASLASRAGPMAARTLAAGRNLAGRAFTAGRGLAGEAANAGRFAVDLGLYGAARGAQAARNAAVTGWRATPPIVRNYLTRTLPTNIIDGVLDVAAPGVRLVSPLFTKGGYRALGKLDLANRIAGSAAGGITLTNNVADALSTYDRTGDSNAALERGVISQFRGIPIASAGPLGYLGLMLASMPTRSYATSTSQQELHEADLAAGRVDHMGRTFFENDLASSNPMRRGLAYQALQNQIQQNHPIAHYTSKFFGAPLNLNPLNAFSLGGSATDEELVADTQGVNVYKNINEAINSGQGYRGINAAINQGLVDSMEAPSNYDQVISGFANYLEQAYHDAVRANNPVRASQVLSELFKYNNMSIAEEIQAGRINPNLNIEAQIAARISDSANRLRQANYTIARN